MVIFMVLGVFGAKNKANLSFRWNLPKPSPSLRDEAATQSTFEKTKPICAGLN
jgi:hypothetical protein